jgi:hypothetical protein
MTAANFTASGQFAPWLKTDPYPVPFQATLLISQDNAGANPLTLFYVPDDITSGMAHMVSASQTTTTITVIDNGPPLPAAFGGGLGHGLAVGDYVSLDAPFNLTGVVASVTNATTYTVTSPVSQTIAQQNVNARTGRVVTAGSAGDKIIGANGAAITARTALTLNSPVYAITIGSTGVFSANAVARLSVLQGELHS